MSSLNELGKRLLKNLELFRFQENEVCEFLVNLVDLYTTEEGKKQFQLDFVVSVMKQLQHSLNKLTEGVEFNILQKKQQSNSNSKHQNSSSQQKQLKKTNSSEGLAETGISLENFLRAFPKINMLL